MAAQFEETREALPQVDWYVLYLRSRFEKKVHAALLRKQVESFLPLLVEQRVWSHKRRNVDEPLFPGYVFVRTDLQNRVEVLNTDGVVRFVPNGRRPSPVPEEQINWVRLLVSHPAALRRECHFDTGEVVRVIAGPFHGLEGYVLRTRGTTRVVISINAVAQSVSVEISPELLERVHGGRYQSARAE